MSPAWHPDGKHLVYVLLRMSVQKFIFKTYTPKNEKSNGFPGINGAPEFSPDGRYLALSCQKTVIRKCIRMILDEKLKRITYHYGIDTEPVWSVDGESLILLRARVASLRFIA